MKQHIFTKGGLLLVFMSVFLAFFACRQEQFIDTSPPTESTAMKPAARQYYDNALADLRKANIERSKTDALFTALDLAPDWNAAIFHKQNGKSTLEVPVKFTRNSTLSTSASSSSTKFNEQTDIILPTHLLISQLENGQFTANIMLIKAENPYPNAIVPDFNLSQKIDNFTGLEYLYNLDGSFNKGWRHNKGRINATFILGKYDLRQHLGTRDCIYYFLTYNGVPIQYLGSSCTPDVFDLSGGNNNQNWGSNSGGGTTQDPPPPCTATQGNDFGFASCNFFQLNEMFDFYSIATMSYSLNINVTNCPNQEYSVGALTYSTSQDVPGSFASNNEHTFKGRTESINPKFPKSGFRTSVRCSANTTFTVFGIGYPLNDNLNGTAYFFVN